MVSEAAAIPGEYYRRQSSITDPGAHRLLFAGLPGDIPSLCAVVQGLLRDFATLLCAMVRHRDVPARVRFGFSTYFQPSFNCDHVVCEYWNGEERRWTLVDPQMDGPHCRLNHLTFDPHDVPHDRLIPAGRAWQLCRTGQEDPDCFGVDSPTRGLWFIQSYLVHDLAALNRMELLCWDCWGLADSRPDEEASHEELALLDGIAALTLAGDAAFLAIRDLYESEDRLRVPATLKSYSPNGNRRVDLPEPVSP